ncbi:LacI family DNA-binding transcriptional regulator [Clostridium cellulovorans]|uniref:Transcriptional regulator, LacI family n=1 Tax=Clostridium cellulovorans (strain ATCC 35296 / DSM 3052 / OCM 3 / 743B) TaxID=573061 RepID=D9SR05_CLOC7|nr:LacI family DNA-binding transcriptional regulator [Clostridium cellulovorans]ADL50293.1 transcriptional regulator, LacI family [Clostridium cellulovorans 743B]
MATIRDIAKKLGISPGTVSKGLNGASDISEAMRQAVLDAAVELGYKPKNMQNEINPKICIMLENMNYENIDQFGYEIISGFEQAALRKGYNVTIVPMDLRKQTQTKYDTYMLKNGYSGAFLLGFELHDDYVQQLDTTKVPTVLLDNYISGNNYVGYVGTDNYEGIKDLINYLKELGHKNIAFLNGTKNSMITQKRLEAFIQSMNENNLPVNDALIAFGHYITDCAKDYVPGFVKNGATAIVCASDFIASGVIRELHSMGLKIPEDISVTGYDDMPIAQYLNPPLTTIRQDRISLGKSALTLLDDLMHNVSISRIELRPKFIKRDSTDKCKI